MLECRLDSLLRNLIEHHAGNFWRRGPNLELSLRWLLSHLGALCVFGPVGRFCSVSIAFFSGRGGNHLGILSRLAQNFSQVRANGFAFAVRVARQVNSVRSMRSSLQLADHLQLARNHFVGRLE